MYSFYEINPFSTSVGMDIVENLKKIKNKL